MVKIQAIVELWRTRRPFLSEIIVDADSDLATANDCMEPFERSLDEASYRWNRRSVVTLS